MPSAEFINDNFLFGRMRFRDDDSFLEKGIIDSTGVLEIVSFLEETYEISLDSAKTVNRAKSEGRPVTAVGTTVVRTLESAWKDGSVLSGRRATSLFIRPGFEFHVVDRLLTNFHLPQSTLLKLVSAFAGYDLVMKAYRHAVRERYRFFSYGDCMLII